MSVPGPKQNHPNHSQSRIESKAQANSTVKPDSKHRKQKPKVCYKFKEEKKKHLPSFLRLHNDILWIIFSHFFTNVHMVDIKTTQRGMIQRRYGAQSLLFVCKDIRGLATSAMFRFATFEIPHFKLHEKHLRENKMTTFHRVQNLVLLWTPAPAATFTTKRGDDAYILRNIDYLRSLEVWLLASQHLRIAHISDPGDMSRAELHETMLEKFEPSVRSQPKWLKRLLRDAPQQFKDVDIALVGFFAFGTIKDADLHVSNHAPVLSGDCLLKNL